MTTSLKLINEVKLQNKTEQKAIANKKKKMPRAYFLLLFARYRIGIPMNPSLFLPLSVET